MNFIKLPVLLTFLLLLSIDLSGQSRGLRQKQINTFDVMIGGDFGVRMIQPLNNQQNEEGTFVNRIDFKDFKFNHRFGFNYYYGLSKSLSLKTGLRFANPGFRIGSVEKIDLSQNIHSVDKKFKQFGLEYRFSYQMLELPLGIKKTFSRSWCSSFFEVGLAPGMYWKTVVEENSYGGESRTESIIENINKFNLFGFLAVGGDFEVANGISGFSQVVARYQFNNLRANEVVERVFSLGLEMGFRIHL